MSFQQSQHSNRAMFEASVMQGPLLTHQCGVKLTVVTATKADIFDVQ